MYMIYVWCFICVATLLVEVVTTASMTSIWFTAGAIVALVLAALNVSIVIQIIVFLVVSIATLVVLRPMAESYLRGNIIATNSDRVIGTTAKVIKDITADHWGEVIAASMHWSAVEVDGLEVEAGSSVKVLAIEGAKLIVKKQ
ncbi:MAG: NfeD family protein [Erysipelotrichaceae bacterium]|nr:NfeD family protein [Erysipelotrichaceae bacterium]